MTRYLIDANVFIQAKNLHCGFDFCPALWDWLVEQNRTGKVASIEKVADELHAGGDELADWATAYGDRAQQVRGRLRPRITTELRVEVSNGRNISTRRARAHRTKCT